MPTQDVGEDKLKKKNFMMEKFANNQSNDQLPKFQRQTLSLQFLHNLLWRICHLFDFEQVDYCASNPLINWYIC